MFIKNSNLHLFLRRSAKFGEDRTIPAELLRILDFQKWRLSASWIYYDVIADHPRLAFNGPNILLKLHVDHVYTLQNIAVFILAGLA